MVTFNVADFARIATEWAGPSGLHAGCPLIVGIDHREFGVGGDAARCETRPRAHLPSVSTSVSADRRHPCPW